MENEFYEFHHYTLEGSRFGVRGTLKAEFYNVKWTPGKSLSFRIPELGGPPLSEGEGRIIIKPDPDVFPDSDSIKKIP